MAWNTEETKRKLREAAVAEFAARGLAGARIENIAKAAGVNKERIYNYFGSKEQLFSLVLADELALMAAAVPAEDLSDGLGEWAGRCFDYHSGHPELVRLLHWEALEFTAGAVPDEQLRHDHYQLKVQALAAAQRGGAAATEPPAADTVFMILAITSWWAAAPQIARMVAGEAPDGTDVRAERRRSVVLAAERIAGVRP